MRTSGVKKEKLPIKNDEGGGKDYFMILIWLQLKE
jgi:hypothetical protein